MAIGLADELFELHTACDERDRPNILEELGDCLFYVEGISCYGPITRAMLDDFKTDVTFKHDSQGIGLFFETVKRIVMYEEPLPKVNKGNGRTHISNLMIAHNFLITYITGIASDWGFTLQDVRDANMCKLGVRYAQFEYSDQRAHDRADKQQEFALNNKVHYGTD
jgi:hypothetical protein